MQTSVKKLLKTVELGMPRNGLKSTSVLLINFDVLESYKCALCVLSNYTSMWIRDAEVDCVGYQQLVLILFWHLWFHCFSLKFFLYLYYAYIPDSEHLTPASSSCVQSWHPIRFLLQASKVLSVPVQNTSSRKIGPLPWPKDAQDNAWPVHIVN